MLSCKRTFYFSRYFYVAVFILYSQVFLFGQEQSAETPFLFQFVRPLMGTEFRILLYSGDSILAQKAADRAFRRVEELENIFSDYNESSEVTALSKMAGSKRWASVSDEMLFVTRYSLKISKLTQGAFDISIGSLTKRWRRAFRQQQFPLKEEIEAAKDASGYKKIRIKNQKKMIRLLSPGMQLDYGGIAKGYAVDEALNELKRMGIHSALVDGGGDLAAGNAPPGKNGWKVEYSINGKNGLETAISVIENSAVATSGDTYRYLEWKGKRYSHIIDPRTGMGLTTRRIVSVFAPTCMEADAWATAVSVGISGKLQKKLEKKGYAIVQVEEQL